MSENNRLKELQKILKFPTQSAFSKALGIKQGSLSDIYREKKGVGVSESIKRVLSKEYSINLHWLEFGEGEVFVDSQDLVEKPVAIDHVDLALKDKYEAKEERLLSIIESQQRTIEGLTEISKKSLAQRGDSAGYADAK